MELLIDTRELQALANILKNLPQAARDTVVDEVSEYLINVLRQNASYRYVSRRAAYGQPFQSDKQRRWFFANLREGNLSIPYKRTQTLSQGWKQVGRGETSFLANEVPYAQYVVGDNTQSRHEQMVGWKQVTQTISEHDQGISRRAEAAAQKAIKKVGG